MTLDPHMAALAARTAAAWRAAPLIDRCRSRLPQQQIDRDAHDDRIVSLCERAAAGDEDAIAELQEIETMGAQHR